MTLGAEFFRWEFATAVAGAILGINPFDEPNVPKRKRRPSRCSRPTRRPDDCRSRRRPLQTVRHGVQRKFSGASPADVVRQDVRLVDAR